MDELAEARREARVEGTLFILVAAALLVALAVTSYLADWELLGVHGWVWLVLCVPEVLLFLGLFFFARMPDHVSAHRVLKLFLSFVILGNLSGLTLLTAALLTEESADLTAPQLLMSGAVLWLINVIVFGLAFWTLDCGGPIQRVLKGHGQPDFQFPRTRTRSSPVPGGIHASRTTSTSR